MKRADHPKIVNGSCKRCACTVQMTLTCPPGFWMTKTEATRWYGMSTQERRDFETKAGSEDV